MTVIIGIDPHKASHTACAIDDNERELAQVQVRAGRRQLEEFVAWAQPFPHRRVGDRVRQRARLSARPAAHRGGRVRVDVPATLSSRMRVLVDRPVEQE